MAADEVAPPVTAFLVIGLLMGIDWLLVRPYRMVLAVSVTLIIFGVMVYRSWDRRD